MGERELQVGSNKLSDILALDVIFVLDFSDLKNMDRSKSSSVAGSHVLVESLNSSGTGEFTVLLVHVVGTRARVVTDPDTKVLDLGGGLFVDQVDGNNLTGSLFDSAELGQEIPES